LLIGGLIAITIAAYWPTSIAPGYLAAAVALIAAPILVCLVAPFAAHSAAASGLRLPPGRADWQGPLETPDDAWRPEFVGDHEERRVA
jgi:hypothetical protein